MTGTSSDYEDFSNAQNELHVLFQRVMENILDAEHMTMAQAFTLKALRDQDGPCKMSDLAASLMHSPAAMTGVVDRMIQLRLVERRSDTSDRRVVLLALTDRGSATLARIDGKAQAAMRRFFDAMPERDRASAVRIMQKLRDFLKEELDAKE